MKTCTYQSSYTAGNQGTCATRLRCVFYPQLVDYLLTQTPSAIAGVATLLEGVSRVAPQLFQRMLQKCGPYLLPKDACQRGDYAEVSYVIRFSFTVVSSLKHNTLLRQNEQYA